MLSASVLHFQFPYYYDNFPVLVALSVQHNTMFPGPESVCQFCCTALVTQLTPSFTPFPVHRVSTADKLPEHLLQTLVLLSNIKQ